MKIISTIASVFFMITIITLSLLSMGFAISCESEETTDTITIIQTESIVVTKTQTHTITQTVTNIIGPIEPPTPEELADGNYALPEFPRITAEKLWQMMQDEMSETGKVITGKISWDSFFIIDVLKPHDFRDPNLWIPGSLNIPNTYYWVTDPGENPTSEDLDAYYKEQETFDKYLPELPRDKIIIVYDDSTDDGPSVDLSMRLVVDYNFNPELVKVLWKGFNHWYLNLKYPTIWSENGLFPGAQ